MSEPDERDMPEIPIRPMADWEDTRVRYTFGGLSDALDPPTPAKRGERLRKWINETGRSQSSVARDTDLSRQTIAAALDGKASAGTYAVLERYATQQVEQDRRSERLAGEPGRTHPTSFDIKSGAEGFKGVHIVVSGDRRDREWLATRAESILERILSGQAETRDVTIDVPDDGDSDA